MKNKKFNKAIKFILIATVFSILMAGISSAAVIDVYLRADVTAKVVVGESVDMWGFALCDSAYNCGAPTTPGPELSAVEGDTLNIHLKNDLNGLYNEPVSLVIPGQVTAMTPVWNDGTTGNRPAGDTTRRVRSFAAETPANGTTEVIYTWNNVKAGTYLYESGTHPAVQVQMGLYGAFIVRPVTAGRAYNDPSTAYDTELTLLLSEIDPALHAAVRDGIYGTAAYPSTINYAPRYFLINGQAFPDAVHSITLNEKVLIRFLNAGLKTHIPALQSLYMKIIAEDGNPYSYAKEQYSVMLPAMKTIDAILTPQTVGRYAVYERALNLINAAQPDGGMLAYLDAGSIFQSDIMTLVTYYYTSILNRAPEPGGAEGWTTEIQRIVSLGIDIKEGFIALGKLFFSSAEYLNMGTTDNAYVIDLYETFLGRTPTQGEADYWAGQLAGGLTRNLLLNYFIFSQEFMQYMNGIFGDTTVRPEYNLVNDLYRGFLSRLSDDAGFNSWLAQMQTAQCNGDPQAIRDLTSQIALLFLNSQEYANRNTSNSEYIEDLYNGILRRGADLAGYQSWLGALNGGTYTRAEMLQLFVDSVEFQARVTEVINAGCSP